MKQLPQVQVEYFSEVSEGQFSQPAPEGGVWSLQPLEDDQHMSLARALPGSANKLETCIDMSLSIF